MGKTITEWEKEIEQMDKEKREKIADAIDILKTWGFFTNEYRWTGIFTIRKILRSD